MSSCKERQIIHIKEVFDAAQVGGHGSLIKCERPGPGAAENRAARLYTSDRSTGAAYSNGDMTGDDSRVTTSTMNGGSGSAAADKNGYVKKKRPAPKPPELGTPPQRLAGDSRDSSGRESSHPQLSPPPTQQHHHHTGGRNTDTTAENQRGRQGEILHQRTVLNNTRKAAPNPPMSVPGGGKENTAGLTRTASPEEGIYAPSSVCQSDTGTIASSGYQSDVMKETGTSLAELSGEEEDFEEAGFTVEFDDEDEGIPGLGGRTHVYREFEGEDFSQYLEDEGLDDPHPVPPPREGKKRKGVAKQQPPLSPASTASVSSSTDDRTLTKKNGLKQKFTKVFTMSRSQNKNAKLLQKEYERSQRNSSIHNFTFSDSKLGTMAMDGEISDPGYRKSQAFEGERRELGGGPGGEGGAQNSHWWNTGTLSARGGGGNRHMSAKHRSSSVPNMLDDSDIFRQGSGRRGGGASSVYSENTGSTASRKSGMYESKSNGSQTKKSNIWKKFSRTLKRETKPEKYDDGIVSTVKYTQNSSDYQDIRL